MEPSFPHKLTLLLQPFFKRTEQRDAAPSLERWRPIFWFYAAIIPLSLFALEAVKILLYHTAQAPNTTITVQLAITFIFYIAWALVPRLTWTTIVLQFNNPEIDWQKIALRLAVLGLFLSAIHLLVYTLMRLTFYATAAWLWEPIHILHNFGAVWLGNVGLWMMVFVIISAVIVAILYLGRQSVSPPLRYEIRDNGATLSVPLDEIYWVKAAGNYVEFNTSRGVSMVRKTLSQVYAEISGGSFLKSHRSALINAKHVVAIKPDKDTSSFTVQLSNGDEAPLSRRCLSQFKALLKNTN